MIPILVRHGIRQKRTRSSWIHDYKVRTYREFGPAAVHVDTEKYRAGLNFLDNHIRVNPTQARSMLVEYFSVVNSFPGHKPAHCVSHSNGTNVTIEFLKLAAAQGQRFGTVILIGSAIHSDVDKSGVAELVQSGVVEMFYAYVSPEDKVIRRLENFPGFYGSLGSKGFHRDGKLYLADPRIRTRTFTGYGHNDYFSRSRVATTIDWINSDLGIK